MEISMTQALNRPVILVFSQYTSCDGPEQGRR